MLKRVLFRPRLDRIALIAATLPWVCMVHFRKTGVLRRKYGRNVPSMVWRTLTLILQSPNPIPGLREQVYVSQLPNAFSRMTYDRRQEHRARDIVLLFVANTLKTAGLFDLATLTYELIGCDFRPDLVAAGLGDIFLVESGWTEEVSEYRSIGVLLDPELVAQASSFAPAWTPRSGDEGVMILRQGSAANPENYHVWWLLACALSKVGDWDGALAALKRNLELAPRLNEQNISEAVAEYGRDRTKGRMLCEQNAGRWLGWFKVSDVDLVSSHAAKGMDGVSQTPLKCEVDLTFKGQIIADGKVTHYEHKTKFDPVQAYQIDDAEILPHYGLIMASGRSILSDTAHVRPVHWQLYTPALISVCKDRALVLREEAVKLNIDDAIYFGHNSNYYHWICEDLPRLLLFEESNREKSRPILVDRNISAWQQELLVRLGVDPARWRCVNFDAPLRLSRLNVPTLVSKNLLVHPVAAQMVRERLGVGEGGASPREGKRLYLSRKSGGSRIASFLNEAEVWDQFRRAGFQAVDTGNLSVDAQIELFADAEIVAGPGGAALTNLIFAPRGCRVLVLASSAAAGETFSSLASALGQDYFVCVGQSYARPLRTWLHTSFDFHLDPRDVALALKITTQPNGLRPLAQVDRRIDRLPAGV
jgi:capsular polysaccharide biosynthesis protein